MQTDSPIPIMSEHLKSLFIYGSTKNPIVDDDISPSAGSKRNKFETRDYSSVSGLHINCCLPGPLYLTLQP